MAYFIHNKYSSESNTKVTLSNGSYTYNDDSSIIVIDYYGLLESGDETYKLLDTSTMGTSTVDTLSYSNITPIITDIVPDSDSYFKFASSINIKSIQRTSVSITTAVASKGTVEVTITEVDPTKTILLWDKSHCGTAVVIDTLVLWIDLIFILLANLK